MLPLPTSPPPATRYHLLAGLTRPWPAPVVNDPVRFTLLANKPRLVVGESVDITVTAELMNISPKLMFFLPGANAYTLRLLLPDGFQQTGGDNLSEYTTAELTYPAQPTRTYRLSGYFTTLPAASSCFRLLRGPAQATSQSIFVDKGRLCIPVYNPPGARLATQQTNSTPGSSACLEAESTVGGANSNRSALGDGQASGGQAVGGFGNASEFMTYALPNVATEKDYTLRLYYVSGDAQAGIGLVVNDQPAQVVSVSTPPRSVGRRAPTARRQPPSACGPTRPTPCGCRAAGRGALCSTGSVWRGRAHRYVPPPL